MSFFTTRDESNSYVHIHGARIALVSFGIVMVLIISWLAVGPQYRLWKAGIERQIQVKDAESRAKAAVQLAQAEVNRAKGVAEANEIIANSITPEYLRYFYIQELARVESIGGKVIYVPTEAGLPILEAGKRP